IDENALVRLISSGDIAGAGLDVFEHEPAVNPKLVKLARMGKVVLLPHMGSATLEGRIDMGEKVIVNIKTFLDGHRPPDRVLPSMLYPIAAVRRDLLYRAADAIPGRAAMRALLVAGVAVVAVTAPAFAAALAPNEIQATFFTGQPFTASATNVKYKM